MQCWHGLPENRHLQFVVKPSSRGLLRVANNARTRPAGDGVAEMFEGCDDRLFSSAAQEMNDRLDFRTHVARRENVRRVWYCSSCETVTEVSGV